MYFLHAINSDRQTQLLNVLRQTAMILGDKKSLYSGVPQFKSQLGYWLPTLRT